MASKKCKGCGDRYEKQPGHPPFRNWCSTDCALSIARGAQDRSRAKKQAKAKHDRLDAEKAARMKHKADKDRVKSMAEWFDNLQTLVNQYVVHVRDKSEPCCTCGTTNPIKYDAGHYRSRGACKELRFELTNIHKQCSVNCNQYGSGMRAEYRDFITKRYGSSHLEWLDGPHKLLKDQLPHYEDVKKEIIRYRQLLRDNGLKPNY
jgi:hypothetical protein